MLLIDAYNVLHAQWCLPAERRGLDVVRLVALIDQGRYAGRRVRIICDGRPGPDWKRSGLLETATGLTWTRVPVRNGAPAEVVWSGPGVEADDVIEDILARSRGLAITVVSSDRRLVRAAGRAGADRVGNGSFLKQLVSDLRTEPSRPAFAVDVPLDRYSVAYWMSEFGFGPVGDPTPGVPAETPDSEARPDPAGPTKTARDIEPGGAAGLESEPLDPLLAEAFEEWRGRFDPADLEMQRWIDGVEPL